MIGYITSKLNAIEIRKRLLSNLKERFQTEFWFLVTSTEGKTLIYSPKNDLFDELTQNVSDHLQLGKIFSAKDSNELEFLMKNGSFFAGVQFNHPSVSEKI